jgi:transcription elongation factor GreA
MVDRVEYLTPEGRAQLEKRWNYLVKVRRQEVAERLHQALQDGGEITENSQYEEAKNEQAMVEADIARLSYILTNAKIIEDGQVYDTVQVGSHVTLVEKGTKDEETYYLVGSAEANPRQGKISIESPLGKALVGKAVGDKVKIDAPDGEITFVIQQIS